MTVEELVRWRARCLLRRRVARTEDALLEALSCEGLPESEIPTGARETVTKFRHLNTADRRRCIRRALRGT